MTTYTGQIFNVFDGKCLSAPINGKDGDPMVTATCDEADGKQKISVTDALNTRSSPDNGHRLSTSFTSGNHGTVDTYNGRLYWSGECGRDNDCDFHVWSTGDASNGLRSGPFQFWGWGKQGGNRAAIHTDGTVRQDQPYDGTDRSKWLTGDEARKCINYGVPLPNCTGNQISPVTDGPECFQYEQWKRGASGCPLAASCKDAGVPLNSVDCTTANVKLAKQCTAVDVKTCNAANLAARKQKCVAMELCVDPDCNVFNNGGCSEAKIKEWEAKCAAGNVKPCLPSAYQTAVISESGLQAAREASEDSQAALDALATALLGSKDEPLKKGSDNTFLYVGICVAVVLVIILVIVFILKNK